MIASPPALTLPRRTPRAATRPPLAGSATPPRFTLDGSPELEAHLARTCEKIAAGLRGLIPARRLEAVLLGGGYGRGEGGVLRECRAGDSALRQLDRPYNDLEFYVFLRGNRHLNEWRFGRALHVLGEILTPQAGLEVEFKIASLAELARSSVTMFSYDLVAGHRWLIGDEAQLAACAHHRAADRIPLAEATRLLMNRGSGLLLAQERLRRPIFTAADADFVHRNVAKAELALGDAVLVAFGHYHGSARERHRQLERIARLASEPWLSEIRSRHASAVEFKLHPTRSTASRDMLAERHAPVVALAEKIFLWLERRRLGCAFASAREYAASPVDKWPDSSAARNLALNARSLGRRATARPGAFRHPRTRVLHALSLLLWEPDSLASPRLLADLQQELQTTATDFAGLMLAYTALWSRVN